MNEPTGAAELRVTLPQESVQALQDREDGMELFVHIVEADRFDDLYADAEPAEEGFPDEWRRLRADQLGVSSQQFSRVIDGDTDAIRSSRFIWSFGSGVTPGSEAFSISFRDLKPDTEYVVYAIQGFRQFEEFDDPQDAPFFGEYYGALRTSLDPRENRTVQLNLFERVEAAPEEYTTEFVDFAFLPFAAPLPPARSAEDILQDFSGVLYSGEGSTTIVVDGEPFDLEFDRGAVIRLPFEFEGSNYTYFFLSFFIEEVEGEPAEISVLVLEEGAVLEPSLASYDLNVGAGETTVPPPGSILEVDVWLPELEAEFYLLPEPPPVLTEGGFVGGAPSQNGQFALSLSGTFEEDFTLRESELEIDGLTFDYDEVIDTFEDGDFEFDDEPDEPIVEGDALDTGFNQDPEPYEGQFYEIGDEGPAGGIIFFRDDVNEYDFDYLEAAPRDTIVQDGETDIFPFASLEAEVSIGTFTGIGSGFANTESIINAHPEGFDGLYGALVLDAELGVFLPSIDELQLMYDELYQQFEGTIGNFEEATYWSSSASEQLFTSPEGNRGGGRTLNFGTGTVAEQPRTNLFRVRAVRAFGDFGGDFALP